MEDEDHVSGSGDRKSGEKERLSGHPQEISRSESNESLANKARVNSGREKIQTPRRRKQIRKFEFPIRISLEKDLSNYDEWKSHIRKHLTDSDLHGFIDGKVKAPPKMVTIGNAQTDGGGGTPKTTVVIIRNAQTDGGGGTPETVVIRNAQTDGDVTIYLKRENKEYVEWEKSDEKARKCILNRLSKGIKNKLGLFETAKELWEAIHQLDKKKRYLHYLPLYIAAIEGDWKEAEKLIEKDQNAVKAHITSESETALIVAVKAVKRNDFAKQLVEKMSKEDLAICDSKGRTALHRAVKAGNIKIAKLLVKKHEDLPYRKTNDKNTPLYYAATSGDREMIHWLIEVMKPKWKLKTKRPEAEEGFRILHQLTMNQLYDFALKVLRYNPMLASFIPEEEKHLKLHALIALAQQPSSFPSGSNFNFLQGFIYYIMKCLPKKNEDPLASNKCGATNDMESENVANYPSTRSDIEAPPTSDVSGAAYGTDPLVKPVHEKKVLHDQALELLQRLCEAMKSDFLNADGVFRLALEQAMSEGIPEIVQQILKSYPYAVSLENDKKQVIFQQAIVYRQEKVFNLIHQLKEHRTVDLSRLDADRNNALHLAGYRASPRQLYLKAGAAFQMQRELQWFKAVERLVLPRSKEEKNKDGKTPAQVFTDTHEGLVKEGERWMKDTASNCTIIASLIATVVFAAAIQVPGGNNDNGHPVFDQRRSFLIFSIANALALFSSVASVIMFLSILTYRYGEEDFLFALPHRLIIGQVSLFASMLYTMVAFGAILYLVFGENMGRIVIAVAALGSFPFIAFHALPLPFLLDMIRCTYFSPFHFKAK